MPVRQQVLVLWLAERALDTPAIAWSFYDGCDGKGPRLPEADPPYANGVAALVDGWCLLQAPVSQPVASGKEHETGPLQNEFVFQRRLE